MRGSALGGLFEERNARLRNKIIAVYAILILANLALWFLAVALFRDYPVLIGAAFLAYSFGLRHAVDADHIAAIDNVTRKLMQQGQRPLGVGFFFSLGHSTIVFALSAAVALATVAVKGKFPFLQSVGSIAGTLCSAVFLIAIAIMNLVILTTVLKTFRRVRAGGVYHEEDVDLLLAKRGFFGRIFRGLFALIGGSWQMYLVGLLFGLGFDTATEVGLLGISAETARALPIWSIMVFPALFAAGMALIDTTDNVLMLGAYGWALAKPMRKLYYNITVTSVSVIVALIIGGIESLGLIQSQLNLSGVFWSAVASLNNNLGVLGYVLVGVFVACWVVSVVHYKRGGYDDIEVRLAE